MFFVSRFGEGTVLEPVALTGDGDDGGVMEKAVEDRSRGGHILKQLTPILQRPVAGHDRRTRFVAPHDDLKKVLARVLGQGAQAHVVDDEQVSLKIRLKHAVALLERVLGQEVAHQIEDRTVADREALLDRLVADGLGQVRLPGPGWADEKHVVLGADKMSGRQFVDLLAGDRRIEAPVKIIDGLERAEVCGFDPALNLALVPDVNLILERESQKLLVSKTVGERLLETDREGLVQAGETQIMEQSLELVHREVGSD